MSGGPSRSGDKNRSNNNPRSTGVGLGDTERVTHRAVGRAPPALAVDVALAAELDDVVQQQEVAGEAELLDNGELVLDLPHRLFVVLVRVRIRDGHTPLHEHTQPRHVVVPFRHRIVGQARRGQLQVEGTRVGDFDGAFDGTRPPREPALLLVRAAQVCERPRGEPAVDLVE